MRSNKELVDYLVFSGVLANPRIRKAFLQVDRKDFVPEEYQDLAYQDEALPIGYGQTISQPFVVAFMLELLDPRESDKVLDVGSGSGYTTALLASIAKKGKVYGLEIVPELVEFGQANLAKYNFTNAEILQAKEGALVYPQQAPYDRILVSAAGNEIPQELLKQLKIGGIMVLPVGESIVRVFKISEDKIKTEEFPGFLFVELK